MNHPFIIYGIGRCRTAWLSEFLTYREWKCYHERAMFMRSLSDVTEFFSEPRMGTVETGAPYGRCLLKWLVPGIREVVVLRPVEECVDSIMRLDVSEVAVFDRVKLTKILQKGDRALRKIARDPNVMVINYEDLNREDACAAIFEFCLPYKFDRPWWEYYKDLNIQMDMKSLILYRFQNKKFIDGFKSLCKRELFRLVRCGEIFVERTA